jgi:Arc/MetJ-type ribon-helix-helix transcriptional regulator
MHSLIYSGMRSHFYSTVSEYLRFLVRRDQRPAAIEEKEYPYTPPRTANQVIEEARREIEAERQIFENLTGNADETRDVAL